MRVLVDTSVWSLSLRREGPADHVAVVKLTTLIDRNTSLVLTGLILQEILQAFRSDREARRVARYLEPVPLLQLARSDYVAAASLRRRCAAEGVAASTADCQIAAAAIGHKCALLTADADFERIAEVSRLSLA
jgi:predicted nucleic acid-binding protein